MVASITQHSATLIDNIFTNNTLIHSKNGLIVSDISDHFPLFRTGCDRPPKDKRDLGMRDTSLLRRQLRLMLSMTVTSLRTKTVKKNVVELPAKNERVWTASFTLVDQ